MLTIFGDSHLGCLLGANTTPQSRIRLQEKLFESSMKIAEMPGEKIHGGDLLHKYSNSEDIIKQAATVAALCELVVSGNHDVVARDDRIGSLQLLMDTQRGDFLFPDFNKPCVYNTHFGNVSVAAIPHVLTQELFDESVASAISSGAHTIEGQTNLSLCLLHANYDNPFTEGSETSLNLTQTQALELLAVYDHVFMSHEHNPRDLLDNRLHIIGCPFPTNFSDISDKRVMHISDAGEVTSEQVWSMAQGYAEIAVGDYNDPVPDGVQFIRLTGFVQPQELSNVAKGVSRTWKECPNLLGLKQDITLLTEEGKEVESVQGSLESLPKRISRELEGTAMLALWEEFSHVG